MQTKLHIDIANGTIAIEGDADLVREVYADFKDRLLEGLNRTSENSIGKTDSVREKRSPSKRKTSSSAKKAANADTDGSHIDPDKPKLDKNLDLLELKAFYDQFVPKNNAERILIFANFLIDKLGKDPPNTDQFFTCFSHLKETIPRAFSQAFRDTSGKSRHGYIEYKSPTEITITIKGTNHLNEGIERRDAE